MKLFLKKGFKLKENQLRVLKSIKNIDIVICFGGDGTLLKSLKKYREKPILPIRLNEKSSLGFRADLTINNLEEAVNELKKGNYKTEVYNMIEVLVGKKKFSSFNDAVVFRSNPQQICFNLIYNNENIMKICGDGFLVCSFFGSTAYNFNINGPITKDRNILIFSPIACNIRNSFVSLNEIEVKLTKGYGKLEIDGEKVLELKKNDLLRFKISNKKFKIVRIKKFREEFDNKIKRIFLR